MIFLFLFLISRIILKNNYLMSLTSINQIQTYEKEISLLKEKIDKSKYEKNEKEINLLEENNILKEKENEYETSLRTKDRKIKELLNLISEYENQIVQLNNQLNTLVNSNKQLKSIMFDLSTNYQKTKIKLSNEKEENKNNNDYISDINLQKELFQNKAKELVNIIDEYSKEVINLNEEINKYKDENKKLLDDNTILTNSNQELKTACEILQYDNNKLKEDNETLTKFNQELNEENKKITEFNYSNENQINSLNEKLNKANIILQKNELKSNDKISYLLKDLDNLSKWINMNINFILEGKEINQEFQIVFENNFENEGNSIDILHKTLTNNFNYIKQYINKLNYQMNLLSNENEIIKSESEKKERDLEQIKIKEIENMQKFIQKENELSLTKNNYKSLQNLNEENITRIKNLENESKEFFEKFSKLFNDININMLDISSNYNSIINYLSIKEQDKKLKGDPEFENKRLLKKVDSLSTQNKLQEIQINNIQNLLDNKEEIIKKMAEDNIVLNEQNKKLIQDNVKLIAELRKFK